MVFLKNVVYLMYFVNTFVSHLEFHNKEKQLLFKGSIK